MVRTQHGSTSFRFEPARILAYSAAIALHLLAAALLLIPLAQAPIRSEPAREARWQVPEPKPVIPTPPTPIPQVPVTTKTPPPARQPVLQAPVDTAPLPIFATDAVITLPTDVAPADPQPSSEVGPAGTSAPLEGVQLRYLSAPPPSYPRDALRAGAEGTVILRVLVGEDGVPVQVTVERGSGNRSLDTAARTQVLRHWKFQPATDGGRAVQAYGLIPVDFKLN